MMRHAKRLAAGILACTCTVACSPQATERSTVKIESSDAAMSAAIRQAQQTLPGFLALAANPPAGTDGYKLKVAIEDGEETEHFWIAPFEATTGGFRGTVSNTPQLVRNVQLGQVIEFDRSRISDWGYVRDGKQVGSFTVCVMFSHVPKAEADAIRREHGFTC
jgi:uncharacterized protein YegJ (DUF2314 family)